MTVKVNKLVPINVDTKNELHSDECQEVVNEKLNGYRKLFKLESEDVDDFRILNKEERKEWWKENGARLSRNDYIEIIKVLLEQDTDSSGVDITTLSIGRNQYDELYGKLQAFVNKWREIARESGNMDYLDMLIELRNDLLLD